MSSNFEFVETYRGREISIGLKNGREMYHAGQTYIFTLESARKVLDKSIYMSSLYPYLKIVKGRRIEYTGVSQYHMGGYFENVQRLTLSKGMIESCNKLAIF